MDTNLVQLKCGSCGCENHKIFAPDQEQTIVQTNVLYIECTWCDNVTSVQISPVVMELKHHKGNGTLANF